ncbi:DUF1259 domain-containing protein [Mesorhizobium sp. M0323]|uniref:DUF1259 domain-containing protein n=1 Tax=Mesorhizobium sp. M0323 TaxID=2956938 RepID=UPI00333B7AE4
MLNTQAIESLTGLKGQTTGDVLKLSVPRSEMRVTLDGFEIIPFMVSANFPAPFAVECSDA